MNIFFLRQMTTQERSREDYIYAAANSCEIVFSVQTQHVSSDGFLLHGNELYRFRACEHTINEMMCNPRLSTVSDTVAILWAAETQVVLLKENKKIYQDVMDMFDELRE